MERDELGRFVKGHTMPLVIRQKISETLKKKKTKRVEFCACGCGQILKYPYDSRSKYLKGHNHHLNWNIKNPDREYLYDAYHIRGLSQPQIAKEIGCDRATVCLLMQECDVQARSLSESRSGVRNHNFGNHELPSALFTPEVLAKRRRRPNGFETSFNEEFFQLKYTGDFSFFVGTLNPDFILPDSKLCIDLFGDYWHSGENPEERIEYFLQRGFKLLVIWESEWNEDREGVIERVNEFLGGLLVYA